MSWLLMLVVAVAVAFLLAPSLFKRDGAAPLGLSRVPRDNDVEAAAGATVIQFPEQTFRQGSPSDRLLGSRSGYMGVIR